MQFRVSHALKIGLFIVASISAAAPAAAQILLAQPAAADFQYTVGQQAPEPVAVTISASSGITPGLTAVLTPVTGTPAGLFVLTISGPTLIVGIDSGKLTSILGQPGLYSASIAVTAPGFAPLTVPVALIVGGAISIQAQPTSLTFDLLAGPTAQLISLTGSSGAAVGFTLQSSTTTGGNWLSVTASSTYTPATLTVSADPGALAPGSYSGTITVTPTLGPPATIPVTLQGSGSSGTVSASPTSLTFDYSTGETVPAAQTLQLSTSLPGNTYTAVAGSTGNWLLVNGVTAPGPGTLPGSLNVTVNPVDLAGGTYQGTITVTGGDGSVVTVPVTLYVNGPVTAVTNPSSLSFVAEAGGTSPAPQILYINAPTGAAFTVTVASTGNWLSVSQSSSTTPAQLTATASPGSLAAGAYTGTISISPGSAAQIIQATLIVSANPVITTSPGSFVVFYTAGNPALAPLSLNVNVSSGAPQSVTASAGDTPWLQLTGGAAANTPFTLSMMIDPTGLPSGGYLANIVLTPATPDGLPLVAPVLLVVTGATAVVPDVTSLAFNASPGSVAPAQTLEVTAATPTAFTAAATTATGGDWLSVSPAAGTASLANTPLTVIANAAQLAAGAYQGAITLTTSAGIATHVTVTFSVGSGLSVNPSTVAFDYTQGGALPVSQAVQVTTSLSFTASANTSSGGAWLSVTPNAGTGSSSLTLAVNPAGLAPGLYSGAVTITPASGAAATVLVTLTVSSILGVSTPTLAFFYNSGSSTPAAQTVALTGASIAFTAAASSSGWLAVSPPSGTTPATLTVSVNPGALSPGSYNGTITVSAAGAVQATIAVTLTVISLPTIDSVLNAASYAGGGIAPGEIVAIFGSSLGPATGQSAVVDSLGFIGTTLADVQVTFNGYPGPVLYAAAGQVSAIVPYVLAGASSAIVEVSFGQARSNTVTVPVVSSLPGIFSADESGSGPGAILDLNYQLVTASNPVSPGSYIQIYATGEGQTMPAGVDGKVAPGVLPLPYPVLPVMVFIGGQQAFVSYAGAAPGFVAGALQVNAQIPADAPAGALPVVLMVGPNSSQAGLTVAVQ